MSDELNKELAALAAKLGVSVEHLWGVLVRQAYIDGLGTDFDPDEFLRNIAGYGGMAAGCEYAVLVQRFNA